MAFAISPSALQEHATALRECATASGTAKSYATTYLTLEAYEAFITFHNARVKVHELRDSINSYLEMLRQADTNSAIELDGVARRSIVLDDEAEAELDAAYPDAGIAVPLPADTPAGSSCIRAPEDALVTPPTSAPTDLATLILTTNWLSPSTLIDQALGLIMGMFGVDSPLTRVGKTFGGDWDRMYTSGASTANLSTFLEYQADARRSAMATSAQTWQGEAATAATTFFARQATAIDEAARLLRDTAPEFDAVVRGMQSAANIAAGLFSTVMDASIIAWGCYAAGAATAATGIGAIIGGICGTGSVGLALYTIYELFTVCQDALTILDGLSVAIGLAVAAFTLDAGSFPQVAPYDNAQV